MQRAMQRETRTLLQLQLLEVLALMEQVELEEAVVALLAAGQQSLCL